MVATTISKVHLESEMAGKTSRVQSIEALSERLDKAAKKAIDRGRRARERREAKGQTALSTGSRQSP